MHDDAPPPSTPLWRRRFLLVVGALAFAALVTAVVAVIVPGGDDGAPAPVAAPVRSDPVPLGPIVKDVPDGCGISKATLARVLPRDARKAPARRCEWTRQAPVRGYFLNVLVTVHPGSPAYAVRDTVAAFGAPFSNSLDKFSSFSRTVDRLGEDAAVHHEASTTSGVSTTRVVSRSGNVLVRTEYQAPGTRADVTGAALDVTADVVRTLTPAAPAEPQIIDGPPAALEPNATAPDPCGLVPARAARGLADGPPALKTETAGTFPAMAGPGVACAWSRQPRELRVSVTAVPDRGSVAGPRLARRAYLVMHTRARAREPGAAGFHALNGPGEEAYGSLETRGPAVATVVLRKRHVLVKVTYREPARGSGDTVRRTALNRAYQAAALAVGALPVP